MADPFLAEIRMLPFNFAPQGWAMCDGQIMAISQNTALFSLIGTYYGGNGTSNFGLPNLQGNIPVDAGQGPGLSEYVIGEMGGVPNVTLLQSELPTHTHSLEARESPPPSVVPNPSPTVNFGRANGGTPYVAATSSNMAPMHSGALSTAGAGNAVPHSNLMPYLVLNFCIALQGVFPQRQ
jgi:microcystin-dependent protein